MKVLTLLPILVLPLVAACLRAPDLLAAPRFAQEAAIASAGLYTNCAACHGASGEGGLGPALKGNTRLADTNYAIGIMLNGSQKMPPFAAPLGDAQIAGLLTTIRNQWGNGFGPVEARQVAAQRTVLSASPADPTVAR